MTRPDRRPLETRRLAPRPTGRYAGGNSGLKAVQMGAFTALNRRVRRSRLGHWLSDVLESGREHPEVHVRLARGGGGLHGLRIAFVSDLHAGSFLHEADLCRLFAAVAEAEPDLVALGGDLIESRPEEILLLAKALSLLRPRLGVFAVPGNHDYYAEPDLRLWRQVLEEHGVVVLCNRGQRIEYGGHSLWLAGVDDLSRGRPDLPASLAGARDHEPVLLLSHHPDFFAEAASVGVDLTVSGHTHGGQITFRGRTPFRHSVLGYWRGHYECDGAQLYVGRGAGTTLLPLRFHAPAEVPFLRLVTRDR